MLPTRVPHLEADPGDRPLVRSALDQATEWEIVAVADLAHPSSPVTPETPAQKVVERGSG